MSDKELINKLLEIGESLDPYDTETETYREEYAEMIQTLDGCKTIINGLMDTIIGLMEN